LELNDRLTQLEDEIKIMKNEVQAVLLDLRESYLNTENPFNSSAAPVAAQPIIINNPAPVAPEEKKDDVVPEEESPESQIAEVGVLDDEPELSDESVLDSEPEPDSGSGLLDDGPELDYEPGADAGKETAREEVKRAWRPAIESEPHFGFRETTTGALSGDAISIAAMAELAQWIDDTVKQSGCERTETILDISEKMGYLSPDLRKILVKFINPILGEYSGKVETRDYLGSIIKFSRLLGKEENKSEIALLYILCQESKP